MLVLKKKSLLTLLNLTLFWPWFGHAQNNDIRYITDILYVPMRSGAGNEYRIIKNLRSGVQLRVQQQEAGNKWLKVTTLEGSEGWIPSQYLIKEATSRSQLSQALAKLEKLEKENAELTKKNRELLDIHDSLNQQATSAVSAQQKMAQELQKIRSLASDTINLEKRYKKLLENHELLQTDKQALAAENDKLKSDKQLSFMFYGAGLLFSGVLLAVLLPALMPKKRYSEWR